MIDIVAQIFLSALFAVGVRWVQLHRRYDVLSVGAVNYLVAFACGIVTLLAASGGCGRPGTWQTCVPRPRRCSREGPLG